jgi:exodeoxyribonuclease VII large subunit
MVRERLQADWNDVWVQGEISGLKRHSSGHWYFKLKDEESQIDAAMFRGRNRLCRFRPEDGLEVLARGGLDLYLKGGRYQLIVQELEPKGLGALQLAFEQLKKKLDAEGLFDPARKRPLPLLPQRVGVVTSPTGAAVRDILRVIERRYANLEVLLSPCRVQGEGAAAEIATALELLDRHGGCDVIIVGRGGGSIEDLWAFNEEAVARAVAASATPVLSAVGHETDHTICDMVADRRAPTPSAAAEEVVDRKDTLAERVEGGLRRAAQSVRIRLGEERARLGRLETGRVFQALDLGLQALAQRVDELHAGLASRLRDRLERRRERAAGAVRRLSPAGLRAHVDRRRQRLVGAGRALAAAGRHRVVAERRRAERAGAALNALSPLAVLDRGYALARLRGRVLTSARKVAEGERLDLLLREGGLTARVEEVRPEERPPRPAGADPTPEEN